MDGWMDGWIDRYFVGLTLEAKIYYCNSIVIGKNAIAIVLILPVTTAIRLNELHKKKMRSWKVKF